MRDATINLLNILMSIEGAISNGCLLVPLELLDEQTVIDLYTQPQFEIMTLPEGIAIPIEQLAFLGNGSRASGSRVSGSRASVDIRSAGGRRFSPIEVNQYFEDEMPLIPRILSAHKKPCPLCGRLFSNPIDLERHLRLEHQ